MLIGEIDRIIESEGDRKQGSDSKDNMFTARETREHAIRADLYNQQTHDIRKHNFHCSGYYKNIAVLKYKTDHMACVMIVVTLMGTTGSGCLVKTILPSRNGGTILWTSRCTLASESSSKSSS